MKFKEEAVKLVVEGGLTVAEAARRLSISSQALKNWVTKHRACGLAGPGSRSVSELEAEVSKLRKKLAETRIEKEILKTAMAYLAKGPQPGTRRLTSYGHAINTNSESCARPLICHGVATMPGNIGSLQPVSLKMNV